MNMSSQWFNNSAGSFRKLSITSPLITNEEYDTLLKEFLLGDTATRIDMLCSEQKIDSFLHVSDEYASTCNLLKSVRTDKPHKKNVYGVKGTPGNYFIQTLSLDSSISDFMGK